MYSRAAREIVKDSNSITSNIAINNIPSGSRSTDRSRSPPPGTQRLLFRATSTQYYQHVIPASLSFHCSVPSTMSEANKFCILKVIDHFGKSVEGEEDVQMDEYLLAYTELNKFFALMGKVFGFVSSDVTEKVKILEAFRMGDQKDDFETFKTMMEHEKESNLLEKKGYVSGSRTLLRLHRGMGT